MEKIKVLIIDDSALIRRLLTEILNKSDAIEVVGTAADPYIARKKIKLFNPDVLTLDVEMPNMDGLTFLRNVMRLRPMPVVMISSLTEKGAETTLRALQYGAVDFIAKPRLDVVNGLNEYVDDIIAKVRAAASSRAGTLVSRTASAADLVPYHTPPILKETVPRIYLEVADKIVAIGSSTGGTEALKRVVCDLPAKAPAIVVSQHLPVSFSASFAKHLDDITAMSACVASDGQPITQGNIYIAPGDKHLLVLRNGDGYICRLCDGAPVNRHKPSVDVMFRSVAQNVGSQALGILLTGMGNDGAAGMLEMREAGSTNIVQDEASSVVWGMPGEACKLGAAHHVVPLECIAGRLMEWV